MQATALHSSDHHGWVDSTTLTYLGLALALIALPFTWWVSRYYATRRNRVSYYSQVTRLVSSRGVDGLSISWRDAPVDDPHLVALSLLCHGPRDISPDDIRAGHVRCTLGVPVLGVVGPGTDGHSRAAVTIEGECVSFSAQALLKGREVAVLVIVDGEPSPTWDCVILDGAVYDASAPPVRWFRVVLIVLLWVGVLFALTAVTNSHILEKNDLTIMWSLEPVLTVVAVLALRDELRSVLPRRDRRVRA